MSTVGMDILLKFFLIWDYNFSSLALCWSNKPLRRTIMIKFVQTLLSFLYGSIRSSYYENFQWFQYFLFSSCQTFLYPYISDWERKEERIGTSKKLFNILFLFNRNSDSKEKKLDARLNLCFIVYQIVGCSFDKMDAISTVDNASC